MSKAEFPTLMDGIQEEAVKLLGCALEADTGT